MTTFVITAKLVGHDLPLDLEEIVQDTIAAKLAELSCQGHVDVNGNTTSFYPNKMHCCDCDAQIEPALWLANHALCETCAGRQDCEYE